MPTVNGPDEITTLDAGDDKVFFSDSNGDVKEVALGASGEVLTLQDLPPILHFQQYQPTLPSVP